MIGRFARAFARHVPLAALLFAGIAAAQPYGLTARSPSLPFLGMPATEVNVPALLSQTGAFDNISSAPLTPKPGLVPYGMNQPFWSDGALKTRWIALPYDGTPAGSPKIAFTLGEWIFPEGTVFVKHFELVINENTGAKRRLETRLLVRKSGGYVYGRSYRWRPDGTDADVVENNTPNNVETITITNADGTTTRQQDWLYPKPDDCLKCHTPSTGGVLGVKTRQLNGNFTYPSTTVTDNQLRAWGHVGMLDAPFDQGSITSYQKLVAVGDTSATLLNRVRSYLDANCAQCHRAAEGPGFYYDARYDIPIVDQRIFGDGQHGFDKLVRFNPGMSRIIVRDNMTSPGGGMPPLAKNVVDQAWINTVTALVNYPFDLTSVTSYGDATKIRVTFNSPVEPVSATTLSNYTLPMGVTLSGAVLSPNGRLVTLTVSGVSGNTAYELVVNNVKELVAPQNVIWPDTRRTFQLNVLDPAADEDEDSLPNGVEIQEGRNPLLKDNDVFSSARLFPMQQYRDFLGREGDAGGIQFYTNQLTGNPSLRGSVIENFFNSPEFQGVGSPIARLYFATFLRVPDYGGLLYQINAFRQGTPLAVIANNFAASPEFQATYGSLDNAQYVTLLYQNILGRTPSQAEIDYHVNRLVNGATRGDLLVGFSESPEYKASIANEVYVTMMYVGMLRRAPEPGGFAYWVSYMDAGNPGIALILGFLNAPEYHNRFLP